MSKIDSLKTSFDTKTFVFEILASFLLILFVLLSYYSFFKSKKNKNLYLFSIILTFSFFLTIFLTLGIAGFAANRPINTFLLPQLVISDAFILGIQKDFSRSNFIKRNCLFINCAITRCFISYFSILCFI